jgi:hypothetical protein
MLGIGFFEPHLRCQGSESTGKCFFEKRFRSMLAKTFGSRPLIGRLQKPFARFLSKLVPILGGIISGTITWIAFSLMANRLAIHLEALPLARNDDSP